MKQMYFTCTKEIADAIMSGNPLFSGGYIEIYPLIELAVVTGAPTDEYIIELNIPTHFHLKDCKGYSLLDCSEGFPRNFLYSITSLKSWNKRYLEQINNGKFDSVLAIKQFMKVFS